MQCVRRVDEMKIVYKMLTLITEFTAHAAGLSIMHEQDMLPWNDVYNKKQIQNSNSGMIS